MISFEDEWMTCCDYPSTFHKGWKKDTTACGVIEVSKDQLTRYHYYDPNNRDPNNRVSHSRT